MKGRLIVCAFVTLVTSLFPSIGRAEGRVWVDERLQNGSFELPANPPWRPWVARGPGGLQRSLEVREGTPELPAPDGNSYLVVKATNKDETRNDVSVAVNLKSVDFSAGELFKITWKARTKRGQAFNRTTAQIIIPSYLPGGKALVKVGKWQPVSADGWSDHEFDCVVNGSDLAHGMTVSIRFLNDSQNRSMRECVAYLDAVRVEQLPAPEPQDTGPVMKQPSGGSASTEASGTPGSEGMIPVKFDLERSGFVTLVVEDDRGRRVRNLLGAEWFEAGSNTAYWDGMDEGKSVSVPGAPLSQTIKRDFVGPGKYRVRGLVRDPLKLTYEFTAYPNVGNPPWITDRNSGSGGWLADHGVPTACAFIPSGRAPGGVDQVLLAAPVSEASQALAWVDLDGNKLSGRWRLGGDWTGASYLASDLGQNSHPEVYLYTLQRWKRSKALNEIQMRIMGLTKEGAVTVGMIPHDTPMDDLEGFAPTGLAVYNQRLVYSTTSPDKLYFYDVSQISPSKRAVLLSEVAVADPRGLAFDANGRLLVISGNKVLRYTLGSFPSPLSELEEVIKSGLEEPRAITLDRDGSLYVADWGGSHQVKVFDASGQPLRVIGRPGKPATGPFDPERMNFPYGMTVDSRGQLWVAGYRWRTPKTVSLWTTAGNYVRSFYGPTEYGGGGTFDSTDPSRMLYSSSQGGVEFKLDWEKGSAVPASIYWLDSETPYFKPRWKGAEFPRRIGGHRYITNEFGGPTSGNTLLTVWKDRSPQAGVAPMVFIGGASGWKEMENLGLLERFAEIKARGRRDWHNFVQSLLVCWTDLNGDGQVQPDEVATRSFKDDATFGRIGSVAFGKDHELLITHSKGVLSLKPRSVREDGLPLYQLEDCKVIAQDFTVTLASGGGQALRSEDGTVLITGGPIRGVKENEVVWSYPSQWPSLHAGHAAPKTPEYPGQVLATTRLLGPLVQTNKGEAGPMWGINSDKGLAYLFTIDGLFVGNLFQLPAEGQRWNVPEANRGMDLTNFSYGGETFWPTLASFEDGRVAMIVGKEHSSIVRIDGLESVRRIVGKPLDLGEAEIAAAHDGYRLRSEKQHSEAGTDRALIAWAAQPLSPDGDFKEWPALHWLPISHGMSMGRFSGKAAVWTAAALAVDRDHLYVALRTRQKESLLGNSGATLQTLFNTGGGLDIMLSTRKMVDPSRKQQGPAEGDVRLVVSSVGGAPKAALYRPVVPGTKEPVIYESPVGTAQIDVIEDVSEWVRMASRTVSLGAVEAGAMLEGNFQQVELAIPLSVLGWNPQDLRVTRGDIGVLIGRSGSTVDRSYWFNRNAGIVNDIPSEARITPEHWGRWEVAVPAPAGEGK